MRAPPASKMPMIGARIFMARSWTLVILPAWVSESEPPNTVKSLENTTTARPLTVPQPVTTPSPGILDFSMPKSIERCSTKVSYSSKEPESSRSSMRSRAVSLPLACWAATRRAPPPAAASPRRRSRSSITPRIVPPRAACNTLAGPNAFHPSRCAGFSLPPQCKSRQDGSNDAPGCTSPTDREASCRPTVSRSRCTAASPW